VVGALGPGTGGRPDRAIFQGSESHDHGGLRERLRGRSAARLTGIGPAVGDLEAEHARLAGLGVAFEMPPTRQPWGGFMALVKDPAGNTLYLDEVAAAHPR